MLQRRNASESFESDFRRGGRYPTLTRERGFGLLAYLLAGAAILGLLSVIAYRIYAAGADSVLLEWAEANRQARQAEERKANEASKGLEADRAKTKVVYRTITRAVDRIVDRPVYRNVCLDPDGLRLARCAILGQSADTCKSDGALPAPVRPSGRSGGIRIAMDYRIGTNVPGLRGEASAAR